MFRFLYQTDPLRRAAGGLAKASFFSGLGLIGLGLLVWLLKDIFAIIAMVIFFMAGFSAIGYSIKLFIAGHSFRKRRNIYPNVTDTHFEDS